MKLKITVKPNPFTTELVVFIDGHFTVNIILRLLTSEGIVVRIASYTVHTGENKVTITDPGKLEKGNYTLEIKLLNGDLLETIQLTKS